MDVHGKFAIAECGDPEVADDFLPMIHLVFANLKTWLLGTHHGVSAKHLQAYLNEFTFRFNRRFYPFNAFRSLLGIASGAQSPTYAETLLWTGCTPHLVGVCVNRIGKVRSSPSQIRHRLKLPVSLLNDYEAALPRAHVTVDEACVKSAQA